ncbi:hypothetical protein PG993_006429 [Apiospora rasikravindrae]|uniref:GDP/GTP exchange factor Sec2 N-terminal domain-containing protein n=1 Tax=Apiospora rasikravindrae TaxID=990691 RepID=A0ABR1T5N7_9PEZI
MGFTGDGRPARRPENASGKLDGPTPPPEETLSPDTDLTPKSTQGLTPTSITPSKNVTSAPAPAPATQPRTGFLSYLTNRLSTGPPSPAPLPIDDELLSMNVETALYPAGGPNGEAFSPAAYKNLQANATGLLRKMQEGLRQRTTALHEIQAERSAEKEEAEETRMRVVNLKVQLEHMATQAQEQEQALKQLMSELTAERDARKEERFMRVAHEKIMAERSISSEDLEVGEDEQRNKWRASSSTLKSEVSFSDTDDSAENDSVFSRSRSPTILTSATESVADVSIAPSPERKGKAAAAATTANNNTNNNLELPPKPKFGKEMSTFQKLMKGISGNGDANAANGGCKNCTGRDSSMAWDTVSMLRDENKDLKQRLAQLEVAVEGALDMVNGIGVRAA